MLFCEKKSQLVENRASNATDNKGAMPSRNPYFNWLTGEYLAYILLRDTGKDKTKFANTTMIVRHDTTEYPGITSRCQRWTPIEPLSK